MVAEPARGFQEDDGTECAKPAGSRGSPTRNIGPSAAYFIRETYTIPVRSRKMVRPHGYANVSNRSDANMAVEKSSRLCLTEFFDRHTSTPLGVVEATCLGEKPGPALCSHDCSVDLHGKCPHGCPSVLLTMMEYDYRL